MGRIFKFFFIFLCLQLWTQVWSNVFFHMLFSTLNIHYYIQNQLLNPFFNLKSIKNIMLGLLKYLKGNINRREHLRANPFWDDLHLELVWRLYVYIALEWRRLIFLGLKGFVIIGKTGFSIWQCLHKQQGLFCSYILTMEIIIFYNLSMKWSCKCECIINWTDLNSSKTKILAHLHNNILKSPLKFYIHQNFLLCIFIVYSMEKPQAKCRIRNRYVRNKSWYTYTHIRLYKINLSHLTENW